MMPRLQGNPSEPDDDVVFFHKGLKLIITGHHYQFRYFPEDYVVPENMKLKPMLISMMLSKIMFQPGQYCTGCANTKQRIHDPQIHAEQWQEVMKWDFEFACGHHDPQTVCGPINNSKIMEGEGGLKGYMTRDLTRSGELMNHPVPGSWLKWTYPNELCSVIQKEPGYVKKFGKPAVWPMGGPGYDAYGYKQEGRK